MGRAFKYLSHAKHQALLPYLFLVIATLAQLAIPALIASIINAVTSGYIATQVLQALNQIPQQFMSTALPNILICTQLSGSLDEGSARRSTQCEPRSTRLKH